MPRTGSNMYDPGEVKQMNRCFADAAPQVISPAPWEYVLIQCILAGKPVYRRARELDQLRTMSSQKNPGTLPAEAATEEYEIQGGALAIFF